jgi:DNA invertase Pin-like site-specific DNA recombinase
MKTQTLITDPSTANAIYLRVSTTKQGESGLGLEGQRRAIQSAGIVGTEFLEVESASVRRSRPSRRKTRPVLEQAIAHCRATGGTLVVAKLDRLARNVEFVFALKNSGIPIRALDLPEFNTLTVGIFASFAQFESERISERTRIAHAVKRSRSGEWVVGQFTPAISRLGSDAKRRIAMEDENNRRAMAYAKTLRTQGLSLSRISSELNVNGFKTAKNCLFSPTQVSRLLVMAERV